MGALIWLTFTTLCGAVVGYCFTHPWWGALIGFFVGLAIMGGGDGLGDIVDVFDGD